MLVSSSSRRSKLYPKARDYCILCISSLIIRNFGKFKRYLRPPQKFSWGGENKFRGGDGTPSHPRSYVPGKLYDYICMTDNSQLFSIDLLTKIHFPLLVIPVITFSVANPIKCGFHRDIFDNMI